MTLDIFTETTVIGSSSPAFSYARGRIVFNSPTKILASELVEATSDNNIELAEI